MLDKDKLYIEDILESAKAIKSYTNDIGFEDFINDRKTYSATLREFEIIGEAVGKLSNKFKNKAPEINWQDIKDLRNLLIHEYFGVDLEIIWDTIQRDIPKLYNAIHKILNENSGINEKNEL